MSAAEKIADAFEAFSRELRKAVQASGYYSSAELPPGYTSRASFNEACRAGRISGAHKRGHVWVVSKEDYHQKDAPPKLRKNKTGRPVADAKQRALASLRARGLTPKEDG